MQIIVCIDDKGGMAFNRRRQSRDRVVQEKILKLSAGKKLWMSCDSARLFPEGGGNIQAQEHFLQDAAPEDFCFVEQEALGPWVGQISRIYVIRWNRVYPADLWLDLDLTQWRLVSSEEFPGYSHEKITLEVYEH